ncbi:MAG: HAMP domain-containing sensor histidine kinase [Sulfuricurvum sp.]
MERFFERKLSHLSLRELNFYMIVAILLVTVVFSSLLIYDEYNDFLQLHQNFPLKGALALTNVPKTRLIKVIVEIATLALILFGFVIGVSKILNSMVARDMERFLAFFESAQTHDASILPKELYFEEFKKMAVHANAMAAMIYEQQESLRMLNASLEDRVQTKTKALQHKNKALEEERMFSQGLLESHKQFIRYAIHETHTPLSVIMANIELFTMSEGRNRYLAKIEAAVKNIFSIYDDLSYLVKKDQIHYPKTAINLGEYVKKRLEFFDEVALFSNLSFVYHEPTLLAWVSFNETKLQRVIDNNLTNAIRYTKSGETITVTVSSDIDACTFWVKSASQKIEDVHKIFEAYYRERKKSDGFGLGLNLVKSICDEEGVAIHIDSTVEYTQFTYQFPKKGEV